jgi:hypothetical protein
MVQQCVGPSLEASDANVLDVRLADAPAAESLPASGNGLRLDEARGLWAPAEHTAIQIYGYREDSYGGLVIHPGSSRTSGVLTVEVENPSEERSMLCLVNFRAKETHNIAARVDSGELINSGWSGWSFRFGYDVDADPASAVALQDDMVRRDSGFLQGEKGFTHQLHESTHLLLPPGGSSTIRFQMGLASHDVGYVRYVGSWLEIRGLGVTV